MGAAVGLIQESGAIPDSIRQQMTAGPESDLGGRHDRWPLVVRLSDRVAIDHLEPVIPLVGNPGRGQVSISDPSAIALARIKPSGGELFVVVSVYGRLIKPRTETNSSWGVGCQLASIRHLL